MKHSVDSLVHTSAIYRLA